MSRGNRALSSNRTARLRTPAKNLRSRNNQDGVSRKRPLTNQASPRPKRLPQHNGKLFALVWTQTLGTPHRISPGRVGQSRRDRPLLSTAGPARRRAMNAAASTRRATIPLPRAGRAGDEAVTSGASVRKVVTRDPSYSFPRCIVSLRSQSPPRMPSPRAQHLGRPPIAESARNILVTQRPNVHYGNKASGLGLTTGQWAN